MTQNDRIELIIEGLPEENGRVRLKIFVSELQNLSAALSKLEKDSNDGNQRSIYEIAALSFNSPVSIVLEPKVPPSQRQISDIVVKKLQDLKRAVQEGNSLLAFDPDLLEDILALAKPVGKTIKSLSLKFNDEIINFTAQVALQIQEALADSEECEGYIEGMLEQINIHNGANTFQIFPDVGPSKVSCHFPAKMYDDAVSAVGRRVEVFGTLKYRVGAPFAHQIVVSSIETHPFDHDIPNWDDLRGRAPDATGSMSSEEFIRELRDAW